MRFVSSAAGVRSLTKTRASWEWRMEDKPKRRWIGSASRGLDNWEDRRGALVEECWGMSSLFSPFPEGEDGWRVAHSLCVTYTNRHTSRAGRQLATCSLLCSHTRARINLSVSCHVQRSHSLSPAALTQRQSHTLPTDCIVVSF